MPSRLKTFCCTSIRWIRMLPPPISEPFTTMSYALLLIDSTTACSRLSSFGRSSSSGAVNGWCVETNRLSSSLHSNSGKLTTQTQANSVEGCSLHVLGHLQAQFAKDLVNDLRACRPRRRGGRPPWPRCARSSFAAIGCNELSDAGVEPGVAAGSDHLRYGKALGAEALRPVGQRVRLLAGSASRRRERRCTSPSALL